MLGGKNIVLGVTGGIAAYKSAEIVSRLKKKGANVFVIMTKNAAEFVKPLTFQTLSQNYVVTDMFEEVKTWDVEHISLAKRADVFLVAPATANVIGKIANGIADDMLTTTIMATGAKCVMAPAMNTNMFENDVVSENIEKLKRRGFHFIEPSSGRLACGDEGKGKMEEPENIVAFIERLLASGGKLSGKRVLVTAGPTIEPIDPFRYITNHSSGKMGYAFAAAAREMGADVKLISGPVHLPRPEGIAVVGIRTASEMYDAVFADTEFDIIVKAAAVSDYRPKNYSDLKMKKSASDGMTIELEKNRDILGELGRTKSGTYLVGFAAETHDTLSYAKAKLESKNLDMVVMNDISIEGSGFRSDNNTVTVITKDSVEDFPSMPKIEVARKILEIISEKITME